MGTKSRTFIQLSVVTGLVILAACGEARLGLSANPFGFDPAGEPPSTAVVTEPGSPVTEQPPICDPFGNTPGAGANSGLVAKLTYIPVELISDQYDLSISKFTPGSPNVVEVANRVFLSQINKPSTYFDAGFQANGVFLKANDGSNLIEDFALFMSGKIKLQDSDPEGAYEFAVLSDDGVVLYFDQSGGTFTKHIDNDGTHADRLGCGSSSITMQRGTALPMQLGYFQGPRFYITNTLYWRNTNIGQAEPFCGNAIGDPTAFAARGWKVLQAGNFVLPDNVTSNPCVP